MAASEAQPEEVEDGGRRKEEDKVERVKQAAQTVRVGLTSSIKGIAADCGEQAELWWSFSLAASPNASATDGRAQPHRPEGKIT